MNAKANPLVYVVDDEPDVCDSLKMLLGSVGLRVKAFTSGTDFLASADLAAGDCLVADVRMPGISGLELQEHLRSNGVRLPVIIITGHGDVAMAVRAMKAGAADFIEKPFNGQMFLETVHRVLRAHGPDPAAPVSRAAIEAKVNLLTAREREVMILLAEGRPNKTVATRLGLSTRTVETHRSNVMQKLEARSLADLVRIAIACELVAI
ncbi:MAG: response regulator transcription factor [Burkholderiales bacterium]